MEALNKKNYFVQPGEEVLISYRKEMCNRIYQVFIYIRQQKQITEEDMLSHL